MPQHYHYTDFLPMGCPSTSGVADYPALPQPTHRSLSLPSPARATSRARPRERRDGSKRHSTRGSTSDDSDGSEPEPPGGAPRRLCECGCGRDLSHKRRDARAFNNACAQRLGRGRAANTADATGLAELDADGRRLRLAVAGEIAGRLTAAQTIRLFEQVPDLASCRAHAIVYRASDGCPSCVDLHRALMEENGDHTPDRPLVRTWRGERGEQPYRSRVHISHESYSALWDELPEPYTVGAHHDRHADLTPAGKLAAFLPLPRWQRQEAWRALRTEVDRRTDQLVAA